MNNFSVPVVLILFNRPELTQKVVDAISVIKPQQLYVIADGPRPNSDDIHNCQAARAVVDRINWNCRIFKNYSETNLGCQKRIYSGLNWVFEEVEYAIILEDDCLPDSSFFHFCDELLLRYKDDNRISAISGNNFQFKRHVTDDSYYFSRYPHCWGWATWRRAWQHCDIPMEHWPEVKRKNLLANIFQDRAAIRYWTGKLQDTYDKQMDSWSFPWTLTCWLQNGLTILPSNNLVSNIGFGPQGTHHRNSKTPLSNIPTVAMEFPLRHPRYVIRNHLADDYTQRYQFGLVARAWRKLISLLP